MKKFRLIFVCLTGLCLSTNANAQANTVTTPPCEDQWCKDMPFNLGFCNENGKAVRKCSSDPNNEPGLQPLKQALPMVLCPSFDHKFLQIVFNPNNPLDPNPQPSAVVFNWQNVETRLNQAARRWDNLCPPQGPNDEYPYCCLKVFWSSSLSELGRYPESTRGFTDLSVRKTPDGCGAECSTAYMVINQQKEFTRPDANGVPTNFFYTEPDKKDAITDGYNYVSLYSLFLHELGHWGGFQHGDESECNHDGSIMRNGYLDEWVKADRDISTEDVCMFKKLYCCESAKDLSSVREEPGAAEHLSFEIIPNPSTSGIANIHLARPIALSGTRVRVVNTAGEILLEQEAIRGVQVIPIDISQLPQGMYMVQLIEAGQVYGRNIIVAK